MGYHQLVTGANNHLQTSYISFGFAHLYSYWSEILRTLSVVNHENFIQILSLLFEF